MKLKRWALIAEIFSALAVFVTLVILLFEVRAGNELTRIASFQDILTALNQQRTLAISDSEISALLREARSGRYPELGTPEGDKLRMFLTNDFNTFNIAYFSYRAGVISDVEWMRLGGPICLQVNRLPIEYKDEIFFRMTADVVEYLEAEC